MKKSFFVALLLGFCLTSTAQNQQGVKFDIGISHIQNAYFANNSNASAKPGISVQAGVFKEIDLKGKSYLGISSLISFYQGISQVTSVSLDANFNVYGYSTMRYRMDLLSLSLPLWYGLKFNRLTVNAGMQFSVLVAGSWQLRNTDFYYGDKNVVDLSGQVSGNRFDLGPRVAIFYELNDRISIEAHAYKGLLDVQDLFGGYRNTAFRAGLGARMYL